MTETPETLTGFTNRRVREVATEHGVTMAEVRRIYGAERWYGEWWGVVLAAGREGTTVSKRVLDALRPHNRYHLVHNWPGCVPHGYVLPEARHARGEQP